MPEAPTAPLLNAADPRAAVQQLLAGLPPAQGGPPGFGLPPQATGAAPPDAPPTPASPRATFAPNEGARQQRRQQAERLNSAISAIMGSLRSFLNNATPVLEAAAADPQLAALLSANELDLAELNSFAQLVAQAHSFATAVSTPA